MALWDIISSSVVLVIFIGVVYAAVAASRSVSKSGETTSKKYAAKGVTYQDGKVTVKTDRPAVTREDQVASAHARLQRTKNNLRGRPDAFYNGSDSPVKSSYGFQRTKKLD